jgi:uncharacterized membrane protein
MSSQPEATQSSQPLLNRPSNGIAYIAIIAALITAAIHLLLAPRVMAFNQTTGILFYLNGLGFIGGVLLFLSRYWQRSLYLVAMGYALVTIIAFFALSGPINPLSITAKTAEAILLVAAGYLYFSSETT